MNIFFFFFFANQNNLILNTELQIISLLINMNVVKYVVRDSSNYLDFGYWSNSKSFPILKRKSIEGLIG